MDESTPAPTSSEASSDEATTVSPAAAATSPAAAPLDLDGIERDLADVEVALARLDAGTYWTDEVTGEALPAELLEQQPTARRG
jgi:RNA polymerase-binding transcription factor DksA